MENWLTIEQVAEILEVSKDTVRRRIKSGEIEAEKRVGNFGLQWMVNADKFNKAMQSVEVVPVTRAVSVAELEQSMQRVIASAVTQAVKAETIAIREEMVEIKEELATTRNSLEGHYKIVDERLRQIIDEKKSSQGFWRRLFK